MSRKPPILNIGDLVSTKGLPSNPDAERFVLGCCLGNLAACDAVQDLLTPEDFSVTINRITFSRMMDVHQAGGRVDRVTLANALQAHGELNSVGGLEYIVSLDEGMPAVTNVEEYAKIVRDFRLRRQLCVVAGLMANAAYGPEKPSTILAEAETHLAEASAMAWSVPGKGPVTIADAMERAGGLDGITRVTRGIITLPWATATKWMNGGLKPGTLTVCAARPGAGKSIWGLQLGAHAAQREHPSIFFSLEMGDRETLQRLLAGEGKMDFNMLQGGGEFGTFERDAVRRAYEAVEYLPLDLRCDRVALPEIIGQARRNKPQVVIVDYLSLVYPGREFRQKHEGVGYVALRLKMLAMEAGICVVALGQLSRESEKENRPPLLADLAHSGEIEMHADNVLFLWDPYSGKSKAGRPADAIPGERRLILAKQRNGETFSEGCTLKLDPRRMRLHEIVDDRKAE